MVNWSRTRQGMGNGTDTAPPPPPKGIEIFYVYVLNTAAGGLAGNANTTPSVVIDADSDFQLIWLIANSTGTFKLRFGDGATGRNFMSNYVNNVNLFGTAQLPFPMLPPYVFKRQGSIQTDFTDTSGAGNTIQIAFTGKKMFPTPTSGVAGTLAPQAMALGALALAAFQWLAHLPRFFSKAADGLVEVVGKYVALDPDLAMEPGYLAGVVFDS